MLTDTEIRKSKAQAQPYKLRDGGGLFLWITPDGEKLPGGKFWRWKYRFEGKEKLMALGKYPDVPLIEARRRHMEARRLLAAGTDPMAQRKSQKAAARSAAVNSFESVAKLWHDHWKKGKSLRHAASVKARVEADIIPAIGSRPISEIKAPELVAMLKTIEKRGVKDIPKRAHQTTGQIFRYAIQHGFADRDPTKDIKPSDLLGSTKAVNHARIDPKDLPKLLRSIEGYRGANVTRLAMKFMAMTFVRTAELIEARWEEFDLEAARWNIPKERMKMDTPHIVPLSRQALEVLETLRSLSGNSEWVFPGVGRKNPFMSNNTILLALGRMGFKGEMTGHGFRGVASTILYEMGYQDEIVELQLAHIERDAVKGAYSHAKFLEPRTTMMQAWSDFLEETLKKGKLLPFRKGVA